MKTVLIDLSILKHINCGLGQVAYNYGCYFKQHNPNDLDIHLLLPRQYFGLFGNNVKYIESKKIYQCFPFLLPKFDVWHAIHQLSHFRPSRASSQYILTIHDMNFLHEKKGIKVDKYLHRLNKKIERANAISTISNYAKKDIISNLDLKKEIDVIYNGVEQLSKDGERPPSYPINKEKPFFFTIGQIKQKKNFHVLLDVMKIMPEYNLYIAGQKGSSYCKSIESRIKEENINNVFLVGEILHSEKLWFYNNCHAFLFPSLLEGFGLPIIEAMFFGKPVFSSDKTSLSEIGHDAAFFFHDFEPEEMKRTITEKSLYFYSHPEMAQKNFEYANSFSYEKHMQQYLNLYRKLLK